MAMAAPVFDVQSLAVHDGKGLRTLVFLQGCPLRCSWCSNPEGQPARAPLRWRESVCSGCLACREACDRGAVTADTRGGRTVPAIDRRSCETCAEPVCVESCPTGALTRPGRLMSADALFDVLRRDIRLFWNTGGGVTFGGGEPLLHAAFVAEVASRLKAYGVGTVIETCGEWDWTAAAPAIEAAETVFFDVKTLDPDRHLRFTGRTNAGLLRNLERLAAAAGRKVVVSVPVVPGLNDSAEQAGAIAALMGRLRLKRARLLPYHRLGIGKYDSLGREYPHRAWDAEVPGEIIAAMAETMRAAGIEATIEG